MKIADIHFLVVEDHDFQRATLVQTLASLGARYVVEAANGHAALAMVQGQSIDIIISDLEMPGMDGMEFIRHISEAGVSVSIILASVHDRTLIASVGTMTEAYGINLLGTIEKPATAQKLEVLIQRHKSRVIPRPEPRVVVSESDISDALSARLFEPVFQPKVDVATGRLKGVEALARWRHPKQGMVGPYAFIPALEANRRIDELTWIILDKAAASCRDWRAAGLDITVAVNLSLGSLTQVGLADRVTEHVRAQNIEPNYITLEVTETIAMTNIARALENLARLRIRGFGLSIDDYGTGYSSMQQLSRIPFTELKIDQSFVMRAIEKDSCRVMLESSLDMARKLRLQAVAEGVETRADWDLLKTMGCDAAQGYFIARPMPGAQIADWASGWAAPE
jgi:EAL domain-containing protein (putative c-di-GMP-specific phosphodiesterase class I)/ActR/RegA family two-component response regulator